MNNTLEKEQAQAPPLIAFKAFCGYYSRSAEHKSDPWRAAPLAHDYTYGGKSSYYGGKGATTTAWHDDKKSIIRFHVETYYSIKWDDTHVVLLKSNDEKQQKWHLSDRLDVSPLKEKRRFEGEYLETSELKSENGDDVSVELHLKDDGRVIITRLSWLVPVRQIETQAQTKPKKCKTSKRKTRKSKTATQERKKRKKDHE